nr:MAG TPA: hypothetical protein [Bacteriophage sp.]
MANYSLTVNSTFNPYSLQELLPIYQANAQAQYQAEEAFSQLQMKADQWEKLANNAQDADVYSKYKSYSNQLKEAANDVLNNGINAASRRTLMNMRAQYASNIVPIEEAYNKRQQQSQLLWQARLQDPTLIAQDPSELGLNYYMQNPSYTPQSYSGKLLTAQSAQAAQNLAKTLSSYGKGKPIDNYTNTFIQRHGLTRDDVQKYLNGDTTATNKVLGAIYQQVYDSSQIGNWANENQKRQAASFIKQGMWSAIGQDTVNAMENFEARENYKFNQQLALLQAQQQQQNQLSAINEVPIYTPEEQKEADKMKEKYKQYFYTKNGRTYLSQKGREEYERQTTVNEPVRYDSKAGRWYYVIGSKIHGGMQGAAPGARQYVAKGTKIEYEGNDPVVKVKTGQSQFRSFLDSLGAQKYLGKGTNWQPGNVGNLWSKYINTGVKGDAKQYMEYDYALNPAQQEAYKQLLGNAGGLYEAKFDKKSGKWVKGDKLDSKDFLNEDNKWNVTASRYSSSGRTYLVTNKEGKQLRLISRNYINPNVEENIDKLMTRNNKISEALRSGYMDGKKMSEADKAYYEQELKNNVQQAQWFQSQVGIQNTTSAQTYAPQSYN